MTVSETTQQMREHTVPERNDKYETALESLRGRIDNVDERIGELLLKRAEYVQKVGELKREYGIEGCYIRPRREAVMLRSLLESFKDTPYPPEGIHAIWRTLIGASTAMESPLNLAVNCRDGTEAAYFLAREYFGAFLPAQCLVNPVEVMQAVNTDPHTVGILQSPFSLSLPFFPQSPGEYRYLSEKEDEDPWWLTFAALPQPRPIIFACLPFVSKAGTDFYPQVAIGHVELLPTGEDIGFLVAGFAEGRPQDMHAWSEAACAAVGMPLVVFNPSPHGSIALLTLLGLPQFGTEALATLQAQLAITSGGRLQTLEWLGGYAAPYILD